jgi:hypothetical protein
MTCWRIKPDQYLDYTVSQLAKRECRSVSNMVFVLVKEALNERNAAQARSARAAEDRAGVNQLASLMRTPGATQTT